MNDRDSLLAERIYAALLLLYPGSFRSRFGADMRELFRDRVRAEGPGARLWMATVADVARHAPAERIAARRERAERIGLYGPARRHRMDALKQDLGYGVRSLTQRPAFTILAVLTLALGIGANTAIFSIVDGMLLRPLPFPEPDRLAVLWESSQQRNAPVMQLSPSNFADWRDRARSFAAVGAWRELSYTLVGRGTPEQVHGAGMSHDIFEVLRVQPLLGRMFTAEHDRPGAAPVVLISYGLWQRWFGGRSDVVGQVLPVDGQPREIIGVMPRDFHFPFALTAVTEGVPAPRVNEVWTPLALDLAGSPRGAHFLFALGRLAPGIDRARAERELVDIAADLERAYPGTNEGWSARVVAFDDQLTGEQRPALLVLSIAVGLLLLLACANVASLLLARGLGRQKEIAIRAALGATRSRIARQLLTESLVLSTAGAVAGLLLASWAVRSVRSLGGPMLPRLDAVGLDWRAVAFTALACIVAAVLFGIVPALQVSRAGASTGLRERGGARRSGRLQSALVVVELALSLVLLAAAALLGESFMRLIATDPGFDPDRTLTAHLTLPRSRYPDGPARSAFLDRALDRVRALPGMTAAGVIDALAIADDRQGTRVTIQGQTPTAGSQTANVNFAFISPGYFEAMGIPIRTGRGFDSRDRTGSLPAIVINESMAKTFFQGSDPIGRRIVMGFNSNEAREVVGVVGDERHVSLSNVPPPGVYVPISQVGATARLAVVTRTATDPQTAATQLRRAIADVDPGLAVYDLRTLGQIVGESVSRPRFSAVLLGVFAASALLLAVVGVYGVISQLVGQRTHEFGVRMALGAAPTDVARLVVSLGLKLALAGVALGIPASLAFGRALSGLLYGVSSSNPTTYVLVGLALGGIAVLAAALPARRATRVDPLIALRTE